MTDYNPETIEGLRGLEENWPDWKITNPNKKVRTFWHYQWLKHGSCVSELKNMMTESLDYFTKTIELGRKYADRLEQELLNMPFSSSSKSHLYYDYDFAYRRLQSVHYNTDFRGNPFERDLNISIFWHEQPVLTVPDRTGAQIAVVENWIESINFCFNLFLRAINCEPDYRRPDYHLTWDRRRTT